MTDRTLGIIYSLKNSFNMSSDYAIASFMARETNSAIEFYTREHIDNILYDAALDYITTCDDPVREISRYFYECKEFYNRNQHDVLISFLNGTQVRRNNEYINGFRDNPYSDKWTMYIKENYGK